MLLDTIVDKAEDDQVKGDGKGGDDGALSQSFYDNLARRLGERLRECEDRVPVVTGELVRARLSRASTSPRAQASSASSPARCSTRSAAATPTFAPPSAPSASRRPSCRSGKRSTASSPPIRARSLPLASFLASRPKKPPSSRTTAARSFILLRWSRSFERRYRSG